MLTLTRSVGETIRIGDDIEVHVVEVRGGTVRLGFKAPREVAIHREEVYRQIAEANLLAAQVTADSLGALAAFAPSAAAAGRRPQPSRRRPTDAPAEDAPGLTDLHGRRRRGSLADAANVSVASAAGCTDTGNFCRSSRPITAYDTASVVALGCRGHRADFPSSK